MTRRALVAALCAHPRAHVREHLSGEWVWCDGWSRQRSIADALTAYAWADGVGRLVMHARPSAPPERREPAYAPPCEGAHPAQLALLDDGWDDLPW